MSKAHAMSNQKRWRGVVYFTAATSLFGMAACASLLGIEDIQPGSSAGGEAGTGGRSSNAGAGASPTAGHASSGGGAVTAGNGGESGGSSGTGAQGDGGDAGDAGAPAAAGSSGAGSAVHGHVIDYWGRKLANVPVEVAGKTSTTDAQGAFSFDSVPEEYDASLVASFSIDGNGRTRAWVYQGLTRRDPTLQIYEGLADKDAYVDVLPGEPSTLTDSRTLSVSFGGPEGSKQETDVSGVGINGSHNTWQGPETTQETAHALIWEPDVNSGFPSKYIAFDSTLVALVNASGNFGAPHSKASFDLSADTITVGTIVGSVSGATVDRVNKVFLRYTSNAVIKLLTDQPKVAGFSYLVPSIPDSNITFVARHGDRSTEIAVVHKDGLSPDTSGISVALPTPTSHLAITPASDVDKVTATTQFSFTKLSETSPFVAVFTLSEDQTYDDILYVVSAKAPFKLPKILNGSHRLRAGALYTWRVETHGAAANVDAMAGPTGFLDSHSFGDDRDEPFGPRTGDGSYTLSEQFGVKIAP